MGLVDWSLDRPGLTSGFVPKEIAGDLDFVSVHLYPEAGKLKEALETLAGFAVGKPVVIEEMFPLKCSPRELGQFIDESKQHASGWLGFYWGKTPEQLRGSREFADAFLLQWLELFQGQNLSFDQRDGSLQIMLGDQPIAEYIYNDAEVRRPYFRHLRTRAGVQVTRTHPPAKGQDLGDHPTMHPGLWLAFGDLGGVDFWRNKGRVRHVEFVQKPLGGMGGGSFTVKNSYENADQVICTETCLITISLQPAGYLLTWDSTFRSDRHAFALGDQEEMGLGVRVATPLAVVKGGEIIDSEGRKNGPQIWGKQADWCQYHGTIDGQRVGIVLMPDPQNFCRSWFHARDYGLLVANPFGQQAFTKGTKSMIQVQKVEEFRLRFGVFVHGTKSDQPFDAAVAYREFLKSDRQPNLEPRQGQD